MSPTNVKSYTHQVSLIWLPKPKLTKDNSRHTNMGGVKHMMPNLTKAESGRNGLPQGRVYQLLIWYQMISPENIHTISFTVVLTKKKKKKHKANEENTSSPWLPLVQKTYMNSYTHRHIHTIFPTHLINLYLWERMTSR